MKPYLNHKFSPLARSIGKRLGVTLVETTIVMIVASAALAAGANMYSDYLDNLTNKTAALQMNEVTLAFERYLDDNHLTLRAQVIANGGRLTVPMDDLRPDYLPDAFQNRTPFNHEYVLQIRRPNPASDVLQGLVYTNYSDSRFAIEPKDALAITRLMGAGGGYTGETDPQEVISSYGNYNLDLATFGVNPGPGVLVSALSIAQAADPGEKYLHRNVTGDPEHNRMNTSIDMNGNNLNNVDTTNARVVNASELVDTVRVNADIADITTLNATTANVTTVNSTTLNANFTNAGVLTATSATISGHTQTGTGRVIGRMEANSIKTDGSIEPGAGEISARSMRTDNWFRSHGNSGWYNETYGGGWYMADGTWIRAYNNKSIYTPGTMQAGHFHSEGNAYVTGTLDAGLLYSRVYAPPGGACTGGTTGQYAGSTMLCNNGQWAKAGGPTNQAGCYWSGWHDTHVLGTCPAGYYVGGMGGSNGQFTTGASEWETETNILCCPF